MELGGFCFGSFETAGCVTFGFNIEEPRNGRVSHLASF